MQTASTTAVGWVRCEMKIEKKRKWGRGLSYSAIARGLAFLLISPVLGIYGLWGAVQKEIVIGTFRNHMTFYGMEARILGLCMFFGLFAVLVVPWEGRGSRYVGILGVVSLVIFAIVLINSLLEIV